MRWRVGHLYAGVSALALLSLVLAIWAGSGEQTVHYLASTNPGDLPDQVRAGAPGGPRSREELALSTPPREPGWYRDYVTVHPVAWLHNVSPYLAIAGNCAAVAAGLLLASRTLALWVPLSAGQNRGLSARLRRLLRRYVFQGRRMP